MPEDRHFLNKTYYVTTVRRGVSLHGSGFLFRVSPFEGIAHPLLEVPSPVYQHVDVCKAFGGKRGFRGVRTWGEFIVLASFDSLFILDKNGHIQNKITHPLFNDIHGIEVSEEGIWVTSTGIDAVICVDWKKGLKAVYFLSEFWLEEQKNRRLIPRYCDYRKPVLTGMQIHPNYISLYNDFVFVCCRRPGIFCQIQPKAGHVRWRPDLGQYSLPHDGRVRQLGGKLFIEVSETGTGTLHVLRWHHRNIEPSFTIPLSSYGKMDPSRPPARGRTNWLRGLLYLQGKTYLAGQAPARLLLIHEDLPVKVITLDYHMDSAVFDISPADHW